ncbi:hypothetical protein V1511DRAFT_511682 [Dipodascopsis uninucleata]
MSSTKRKYEHLCGRFRVHERSENKKQDSSFNSMTSQFHIVSHDRQLKRARVSWSSTANGQSVASGDVALNTSTSVHNGSNIDEINVSNREINSNGNGNMISFTDQQQLLQRGMIADHTSLSSGGILVVPQTSADSNILSSQQSEQSQPLHFPLIPPLVPYPSLHDLTTSFRAIDTRSKQRDVTDSLDGVLVQRIKAPEGCWSSYGIVKPFKDLTTSFRVTNMNTFKGGRHSSSNPAISTGMTLSEPIGRGSIAPPPFNTLITTFPTSGRSTRTKKY